MAILIDINVPSRTYIPAARLDELQKAARVHTHNAPLSNDQVRAGREPSVVIPTLVSHARLY
jgi:hypothetical protein